MIDRAISTRSCPPPPLCILFSLRRLCTSLIKSSILTSEQFSYQNKLKVSIRADKLVVAHHYHTQISSHQWFGGIPFPLHSYFTLLFYNFLLSFFDSRVISWFTSRMYNDSSRLCMLLQKNVFGQQRVLLSPTKFLKMVVAISYKKVQFTDQDFSKAKGILKILKATRKIIGFGEKMFVRLQQSTSLKTGSYGVFQKLYTMCHYL